MSWAHWLEIVCGGFSAAVLIWTLTAPPRKWKRSVQHGPSFFESYEIRNWD